MAFLGLGLYLLPALFKNGTQGQSQRPNGVVYAWVDSFLLPDQRSDLPWQGDLPQAIAEARKDEKKRLILIDFTGKTCTNCSYNERNIFTKPEIRRLLLTYQLVQLYTDTVPQELYPAGQGGKAEGRQRADARANLDFQRQAFGTEQLPLYVILEPLPDGKVRVVATYEEGKINDEAAFQAFLSKPLQATPALAGR
jgi:thiol:disulfide interchange protein DsbD